MSSMLIQVVAFDRISFFFKAQLYSIVWTYNLFLIHSSAHEYFGYFHLLAIMNTAAISMSMSVSPWNPVFNSLGYISRNGISGSYGSSGRKAMTNLDSMLRCRDTTLPTKVCLAKGMVFPVVMYGCESWTIKKSECRRIDAFELWCWRRLLRVPWTARRSNQSILKEISPGFLWKEWCWSWNSSTLATSCEELTTLQALSYLFPDPSALKKFQPHSILTEDPSS